MTVDARIDWLANVVCRALEIQRPEFDRNVAKDQREDLTPIDRRRCLNQFRTERIL